ncbi:MAG: hypothetical protein OXB84_09340 [Halobacteriovoraceae bacterium]|nr:hypothetical protein [Halobacteriovoraceae bacterium]
MTGPVSAMELVRVLGVSTSGSTIKIDRGSFERIKQKDFARFMVEGDKNEDSILNVGEGEAVKVHSNYSIWHIPQVKNVGKLRRAKNLFVTFYSETIKGRKKIGILQKKIVVSRDEVEKKGVDQALEDAVKPIPDSLIKKGDKYGQGDKLVDTKIPKKHDMETVNFDTWSPESAVMPSAELKGKVGKKKQENPSLLVKKEKIKKKEMKKIFNSTVDGNIAKVNKAKGKPQDVYFKRKIDEHLRDFKQKQIVRSVYEDYLRERKRKKILAERALEKLALEYRKRRKEKGALWSAEMDDDQLRRFYVRSGVVEEEERRRLVTTTKVSNEFFFRYFRSFRDHTSDVNDINRGVGTSIEIGHEFHLVRTSKLLSPFTLSLSLGLGSGYYHLGNEINGQASKRMIGGAINWYFHNLPYMFKKYIFYVGTGISFGSAGVESPQLTRDYQYQVQTFPSVYLGGKYNYKMPGEKNSNYGVGVNFLFSMDRVRLSLGDNAEATDNIDGLISFFDIKLSAGLSLFF